MIFFRRGVLRWVLNLLGQSYFCSSSGHILSILNLRVSLESDFFTLLMVHRNFRFFKNCRFFAGFSLKLSVASDLIRRVLMTSGLFLLVQEDLEAVSGLVKDGFCRFKTDKTKPTKTGVDLQARRRPLFQVPFSL